MSADIQTYAALAIVAVTALTFLVTILKRRKQAGCGGGCGCPTTKPLKKNGSTTTKVVRHER